MTTAVIAATLTSIIIFVPLIFGKRGTNMSVFLGHAGRSIIFALLSSLFISLTLIPIAVAHFFDIKPQARSGFVKRVTELVRPSRVSPDAFCFADANLSTDGSLTATFGWCSGRSTARCSQASSSFLWSCSAPAGF
ncbi:MAG: hypothetical protein R2748_02445 [Bryobacterales bacterium]